jgi:hypothetical protein
MHSNQFDSMILGNNNIGQGLINAVEGTHRTLRVLVAKFARRLSLRLDSLRALSIKRTAGWRTTPMIALAAVAAACPSNSAMRRQRQQRWMSGVVVDPGTVGVR